jgi:YesN/AraC family two-component response regulator
MDDPWTYSWVGFHGLKAELYLKHAGLMAESPVFTHDRDDFIKDCFSQMIATKKLKKSREIRLMGLLYLFLSQLIEISGGERFADDGTDRKEQYVRKVLEYVEMNYSRKVRISDIAHHVGLDRSYLGSIFREHLDCTLQDFLINFRINKACELMKSAGLSIGDISRSVGYDDQLLFSKVFRSIKGIPPREYRKQL